ncbi:SDR family NAD(P)-dependent oxidoreductase [Enterococcus rivorum]|uniref:2-deoxy-D-gluconate 3-dehydrogenase n=1 Tax=Enterococcus rivorum TaxID=762845 RepID=A0A1E5KV73_9ENTE|nr:SDR family oxidoreductase [Enterococcus rivorum]MBP2100389.1 2-deoxy-D-gluconate 3-dehydrogenase [Enterococcus rivorum]OEH81772.1 hypothetical protein BCR26_15500 [Enterococcus rivorum]
MYSYSLAGKTALVTGASQGIGFEIAKVLSYNGANIIGVANSDLAAVKAVVEKNGKQFSGFVVDLSSESEVIEFVSTVHEKVKTIDILVNNAGVTKVGSTLDMLDSEYDLTFNVNMKAPYILSREIGRQMIQQGGGKIINTASIHGFIGSYEVAAYAATKHAIVGLTKALANEWGQYNINVNAVAPGFTKTANTKGLQENEVAMAEVTAQIPLRRWANPEDIAWPVAFLASEASAYVNGHTLVVDGGYINN